MLNDNFSFPNANNSYEDAIQLGREGMTQDTKTITPY